MIIAHVTTLDLHNSIRCYPARSVMLTFLRLLSIVRTYSQGNSFLRIKYTKTLGFDIDSARHSEIIVHGPDRPRVHPPPRQERMRTILFCSWDLSEHEKWMPPSPNWDGLPVGRHFQNGRNRN